MSAPIAGFICALILGALVIAWIAYCMFFRERPKSGFNQYSISDIKHRNYILAQEQDQKECKKEIAAGIFILPSHHKQESEYEKRPDYPESPTPVPGNDKLVEILSESPEIHYKEGIYEVDSAALYHSDV